jgi:hypothetical protein
MTPETEKLILERSKAVYENYEELQSSIGKLCRDVCKTEYGEDDKYNVFFESFIDGAAFKTIGDRTSEEFSTFMVVEFTKEMIRQEIERLKSALEELQGIDQD